MKKTITINTAEFSNAVASIAKYAVDTNTYKIGIEFPKEGNTITLISRSNSTQGKASIEAESIEGAYNTTKIAVSISYLGQILKAVDGETITLTLDSERKDLILSSEKSEFKLLIVNDDIERQKFNEDKVVFSKNFTMDEYNHILTVVSCATDQKDTARPAMGAVAIKANGSALQFFGASPAMMATYTVPDQTEAMANPVLLSPQFHKIRVTADVELMATDTLSRIRYGNLEFQSPLIYAPTSLPYESVIENTLNAKLKETVFNLDAFKRVLNRLDIYSATDKGDPVKIEFMNGDNGKYLYMHTSNKEFGTFKENFDVSFMSNELSDSRVAVDIRYLKAIANIETEDVSMNYIGENKQVLFSNVGNRNFMLLISPLRIPETSWTTE